MLIEEYVRDYGYSFGAPNAKVESADKKALENMACKKCGHLGVEYYPIHKIGAYVSFAVCPQCNRTEKFFAYEF